MKIFPLITALCAMLSVTAGCKEEPRRLPGGGSSGGGTGGTSTSIPQTLDITPIGGLNQAAPVINSHAGTLERSQLKVNFRSYAEITQSTAGIACPIYPRIKKRADGGYVMFYQNNQIGADSYYVRSSDLTTWTNGGPGQRIFARYSIIDSSGETNERRYSTCDGLVLANGDVIAVASYRANRNYPVLPLDNGLVMSRSTDNGATWSEPVEIYRGTNWEPFLMQLPSGEIHCYFSDARPEIAQNNSGTSLIVSNDNGATWTPSFGEEPFKVIRKIRGQQEGHTLFTDQMPTVVKLNGTDKLAAAMEAYNGTSYYISFAWSDDDGEWPRLTGTQEGPSERLDYAFLGSAPYMTQFPSGETVMNYNVGGFLRLKIGDTQARNFGEDYTPFANGGSYWGSVERIDGHQFIATAPSQTTAGGTTTSIIMLARISLNHAITATSRGVNPNGDTGEWQVTDDALFVGEKSQAQATLRVSADDKNVYFLVETLDEAVSRDDYACIFLGSKAANNAVTSSARRIRVSHSGFKSMDMYAGGWKPVDSKVSVAAAYDATLSDNSDTDNGWIAEVAVPRSELDIVEGGLLVNFSLFDTVGGEDAIANTSEPVTTEWIPVSGL